MQAGRTKPSKNDWKARVKRAYVREDAYVMTGINKVQHVRFFSEFYILVAIFLKQYGIAVSFWLIPVFYIIVLACFRTIGRFWDLTHLYVYEQEFGNARNNFVAFVRGKLERKRKT